MNTFSKKIIALITTLVLIVSMLIPAFADDGVDRGWKSNEIVHELRVS